MTAGLQVSFRKMSTWFLLSLCALTCCCGRRNGALSCPDTCTCHFSSSDTTVVCSEASLSQFPSDGLPGNTTSLSIQSTNLSTITANYLQATPLLKELQLYYNNLSTLPSDLLRAVPHLHTLDLTGNHLHFLPPYVFSHAPLHNLVLKNNLISGVDADWLPDNSNLTWLDLSGNHLTAVPTALFQKLRHLKNLDLSHNRLEKLLAGALNPLSSLERLNLEGNQLSALDPSAFRNTPNLTHLFLQENQLEMLPPTLLQGLHRLDFLFLNFNRLGHISNTLLEQLSSPRTSNHLWVAFSQNPWVCDKKVEDLWRWLQKNQKKAFLADDIRCASPESLKERSVMSLTDSELGL
ncbi:leucine-rich alpha-2-glycoprotein isoform X1 [Salvelinus sp. IW2-2015]|uniref:leucine-rich alpha-2-glycoprotein isoform X1 n=2 Tax=Salvelinus sp. IW2-2015 TaxID=2691554 RepID=UPI000CDFD215|nr:leucine-rich alpha-2-glycoprotein isoform X1 [Salvelinus alpinus]